MKVRKFKLSDKFVEDYEQRDPPWGPVGYVTYKRTYSRRLSETIPDAEGTEEWFQTCRRVIEWMFTVQKEHITSLGLEWNDAKAQRTAKEAYERMFVMKWLPPGRGLWQAGTRFVEEKTAASLFNCAFRSTKDLAERGGYIFGWIMDALMLGIGVGFDQLGAGTIEIKNPTGSPKFPNQPVNTYTTDNIQFICQIADSREGWVESVVVLLDSFFYGNLLPTFDYTLIRPFGTPINGFGGTSSGHAPLEELHKNLIELLTPAIGQTITDVQIVDIENLMGKCVVAGNVRRSAALAQGSKDSHSFLTMKNDQEKLYSHRWGSNNSIVANIGMDYTELAKQSAINGEPGYIWLDTARNRGRMADPPRNDDIAVMGFNPCVEQQLESAELCCLTETFPWLHKDYEDYKRTLKIAYLYAKTVTLVRTHWPETNAIMLKNRRIGLSMSGVVQAFNIFGRREILNWCDTGYKYVENLDIIYSDWLCIPRSKRRTSIKPSGTVSLLNGSTPGVHFPEDEYYIRRIRFSTTSPVLEALLAAGYPNEIDAYSPNTIAVSFPVKELNFVRGKRETSMWEQLEIAAAMQYHWADNAVSVTVTFKDNEADQIADALAMYEHRLKAVSFLRYQETGYEQAPYEPISKETYESMCANIRPISKIDVVGAGTKFCDGETCAL